MLSADLSCRFACLVGELSSLNIPFIRLIRGQFALRLRGSEFLKTVIIPEWVEHRIEPEQCRSERHDLWKHFVDLAYWNVELSGLASLSESAIFLQKATKETKVDVCPRNTRKARNFENQNISGFCFMGTLRVVSCV